MLSLLIAQAAASPEPISGGAGWVGAGLLGLVLGWLLLVHLPAKDKQLTGLVEAKDKALQDVLKLKDETIANILEAGESRTEALLAQKWQMLQTMSKEYKESLLHVTNHCEAEVTRIVATLQDLSQKLDNIRYPRGEK